MNQPQFAFCADLLSMTATKSRRVVPGSNYRQAQDIKILAQAPDFGSQSRRRFECYLGEGNKYGLPTESFLAQKTILFKDSTNQCVVKKSLKKYGFDRPREYRASRPEARLALGWDDFIVSRASVNFIYNYISSKAKRILARGNIESSAYIEYLQGFLNTNEKEKIFTSLSISLTEAVKGAITLFGSEARVDGLRQVTIAEDKILDYDLFEYLRSKIDVDPYQSLALSESLYRDLVGFVDAGNVIEGAWGKVKYVKPTGSLVLKINSESDLGRLNMKPLR